MTPTATQTSSEWRQLDVDREQLNARYEQEREKRSRKEGIHQYQHVVNSDLRPMTDDPFVAPGFQRPPVSQSVDFVILGGGVGGLVAAAHLVKAGFDNFLIIEKGGDFGGVWYWNRYPGIQIDIESYIYMPLLEDMEYMPSKKYAHGDEIRDYLQSLAKHFGLYSKGLLQTQVTEARWDEGTTSWNIATSRHDTINAKWLVPATGSFDSPKFPGISGIGSFRGHQFHTSRWDYKYTGGHSGGDLVRLADKRVGIIGTGATAVQVIPHLGKWSKELYVFQRTPSTIDVRGNRFTDEKWYRSQPPGWQQERMKIFGDICSGVPVEEDLVSDGWTESLKALTGFFGSKKANGENAISAEETEALAQLADFKKTEAIRQRVDQIVKDPATAAGLKPYYNLFCKRPCFHDDYLPTFNRPNVTLVNTDGRGVDRITETGIVVKEKNYAVDCIVYATGFEYNSDWNLRHDSEIYGTSSVALSERWKDGAITLHGWASHGFPNCFFVHPAQTAGFASYGNSLDSQAKHLVYVMSKCKAERIDRLEAKEDAENEWLEDVLAASRDRGKYLQKCTPGYYNDEGHVSDLTARNNPYGRGGNTFLDILDSWRKSDRLEGLKIHRLS